MTQHLHHAPEQGSERVGPRITVYDLLPYFLDPTATEDYIGRVHGLTPEQVANARAYVLAHPDTVLAQHLKIEERIAAGNPPEVVEQAERTRATLQRFKEWLDQREQAEAEERADGPGAVNGPDRPDGFPTFREWLAEQESRAGRGS